MLLAYATQCGRACKATCQGIEKLEVQVSTGGFGGFVSRGEAMPRGLQPSMGVEALLSSLDSLDMSLCGYPKLLHPQTPNPKAA